MSSVEIVEVINAMRGPGKAELRHDHFMAKVAGHPGIAHPNFRGGYFDPNGQERPCYYLPKREAELMVMSEIFPSLGNRWKCSSLAVATQTIPSSYRFPDWKGNKSHSQRNYMKESLRRNAAQKAKTPAPAPQKAATAAPAARHWSAPDPVASTPYKPAPAAQKPKQSGLDKNMVALLAKSTTRDHR